MITNVNYRYCEAIAKVENPIIYSEHAKSTVSKGFVCMSQKDQPTF
jgi:hypothetical protein